MAKLLNFSELFLPIWTLTDQFHSRKRLLVSDPHLFQESKL